MDKQTLHALEHSYTSFSSDYIIPRVLRHDIAAFNAVHIR